MSLPASARAYPAMLRAGFAAAVAYRAEFLIWMISTNMPLVMLAIWSAVAREGAVPGYSQEGFTAYYLCALLVRLLTGAWVVWELTMEIRSGALSLRLLRPVHPLLAYSAENLAAVPLRAVISLPIVVCLFVFARGALSGDWVHWVLLPLAMVGAWLLTFLVMAMIGTLALWFESATSLFEAWLGVSAILSGYLIPLDLFPASIRVVAQALPFRFLLSFPVELVLGRHGRADALLLLGAQWAYVGVALLATHLVWRSGLRRFAAFGG